MKSPVSRKVRDAVFRFGFRHRHLYRVYQLARRAAVLAFELGGRSEPSDPPWAIDWHRWEPAQEPGLDRKPACRTCGLRGVPPGTLHRALDRAESDAAGFVVGGGCGWVLGTHSDGKLPGVETKKTVAEAQGVG